MMKPDAALLADPALSNREIARRVGHNHHYVAGYRAALAATGWVPAADAAKHPGGVGPKPAAPAAWGPSRRPRRRGLGTRRCYPDVPCLSRRRH
jgi:hypothetical protein